MPEIASPNSNTSRDGTRTHRSLDKDAPISRPVQRAGSIISYALLGGLHHHYVRVQVFGTHRGEFLWRRTKSGSSTIFHVTGKHSGHITRITLLLHFSQNPAQF